MFKAKILILLVGLLYTVFSFAVVTSGNTPSTPRTLQDCGDGTKRQDCGTPVDNDALCALSNYLCVGSGEEYDTDIPFQEVAFQNAVNAATPGDTVLIRAGAYVHAQASPNDIFLVVGVSGTPSNRITIRGAEGESVSIEGFGFTDNTTPPPNDDEVIIQVTGNYITLSHLELFNGANFLVEANGSYGIYEELLLHDSWMTPFVMGRFDVITEGNIVRYNEAYGSRHSSGFIFNRRSSHTTELRNNLALYNLSYNHGYEPDGDVVPPITGDSAGGGNSDALGFSKDCHDRAGDDNSLCPNNLVVGNIGWNNADDIYDFSAGEGTKILGNIALKAGPQGQKCFKVLRHVHNGLFFGGNIAIGCDASGGRGFEPRFEDEGGMVNNLATGNTNQGFLIDINVPGALLTIFNNISYGNGTDTINIPNGALNGNNLSGSAQIVDSNFDYDDVNFSPSGVSTIRQKHAAIYSQIRGAFTPIFESSLIDAGTLVAGVHCATADDSGSPPAVDDYSCLHWRGSAPDIGPVEYAN